LPTLPKLFDAIQKGIVQLDVRSKKMFSWECREYSRGSKRWESWQSYR